MRRQKQGLSMPRVLAAGGSALLVAFLVTTTWAQDYRAPRTAYGAPDLDGTWTNNSLTSLERPEDLKALVVSEADALAYEKDRLGRPPKLPDDTVGGAESEWWDTDVGLATIRGTRRSSWIVHPADGQIPLTAQAKAHRKARRDRRKTDFDHPESRSMDERCQLAAVSPPLLNGGYNDNFQFVQTRDRLAIVAEYMSDLRVVRIGDAAHPPPHVRVRGGDSVGRWEGDTLVIESTNFTPAEVDPPDGDPRHDMRVVERITRISPTELHYAFRVESPATDAQSWNGEMVLRKFDKPTFEFACHEGNYSLSHMLAGGRQADAEASKPAAGGASAPAR
jgi:hypothetical protein